MRPSGGGAPAVRMLEARDALALPTRGRREIAWVVEQESKLSVGTPIGRAPHGRRAEAPERPAGPYPESGRALPSREPSLKR